MPEGYDTNDGLAIELNFGALLCCFSLKAQEGQILSKMLTLVKHTAVSTFSFYHLLFSIMGLQSAKIPLLPTTSQKIGALFCFKIQTDIQTQTNTHLCR